MSARDRHDPASSHGTRDRASRRGASRTNLAIAGAFVALVVTVIALVPRDGGAPPSGGAGDGAAAAAALASTPPGDVAPADRGGDGPGGSDDAAGDDAGSSDDDAISVRSLVREMAELDHLARLPRVPFVAKQESSYDRRSKRPQDGDAWFANDDFITNAAPNLVRVETDAAGSKRYVLLDARGAGAVVRLWTATPTGTLRIFIDDEPRPALEAPTAALLAGRVAPFGPPFGQVTAMGHSLYFPFPFRKRCLITLDTIDSTDPFSGRTVDKVYYQIGYRLYPHARDDQVHPFSNDELARARPTIARVAAALTANHPFEHASPARTQVTIERALVDATHPSVTVVQAAPAAMLARRDDRGGRGGRGHDRSNGSGGGGALGGGVITTLRLSTPERDPARLRATILTIAFDGEPTVRAPLVDFFGTGPGWNAYASLPMSVGADGSLACRFPMPFRSRAIVTIARAATAPTDPAMSSMPPMPPLEVTGAVTVEPRPFGDDTLLFHARFRPPARMSTRPLRDVDLGTLDGRGQQIGTVLSVENPAGAFWWGEGDEKITVDGETFPSLFGTGTEDYFGFAWSSTETFAHAYHAQTRAPAAGSGFGGWFSMNRFLVLDPVPFTSRLRFDLELWHWSETTVSLSALLYWYARPGGNDDFPR